MAVDELISIGRRPDPLLCFEISQAMCVAVLAVATKVLVWAYVHISFHMHTYACRGPVTKAVAVLIVDARHNRPAGPCRLFVFATYWGPVMLIRPRDTRYVHGKKRVSGKCDAHVLRSGRSVTS